MRMKSRTLAFTTLAILLGVLFHRLEAFVFSLVAFPVAAAFLLASCYVPQVGSRDSKGIVRAIRGIAWAAIFFLSVFASRRISIVFVKHQVEQVIAGRRELVEPSNNELSSELKDVSDRIELGNQIIIYYVPWTVDGRGTLILDVESGVWTFYPGT